MNPLNSVRGVIVGGFVLAIVIAILAAMFVFGGVQFKPVSFTVWIHVLAGVTWIGILYYFNFIQVPALADAAADEGGPGGAGITKYVAPRALWWFRWGAALTWLSGVTVLHLNGWLVDAITLGMNGSGNVGLWIGVGAWFGTIMAFNVWFLIWPAQKKILGLVEATPEQIASARKVAFIASRTNTLLSIPMLMSMVSVGHAGFFL